MSKFLLYTHFFLVLILISCGQRSEHLVLASPDQTLQFGFMIDDDSETRYEVIYRDSVIISNALLGLVLTEEGSTGSGVMIGSVQRTSGDHVWNTVYGERSKVHDYYNGLVLDLIDVESGDERMSLEVRAYNEGIAFRYVVSRDKQFIIDKENTTFPFGKEVTAWVSYRAQAPIVKTALSTIEDECERPLLVEVNQQTYVALGEGGLVDFASMKFSLDNSQKHSLVSSLSSEVVVEREIISPWRYIMVARSPSEILENNDLILNLNEPSQIEDYSWIKPGKVIREVTLTTIGGRACVDFAELYKLQYVEFDAGWYGNEYDDASDATSITVDPKRSPGPLDLQEVIDYARSKDIGIILYVNRRSLEKQLDEVLPLLSSWGVSGLKYGFVNVGTQQWTTWLHDAVRKAADHQLMVDIHDEYRPTGYSRTYPNLMTQEGIRGDEESPPNEMVINTIFTRMIAGAGDQTNCYFAERVTESMGSHASQMAKSICIYSPWQFLFWYDRPEGSPVKKGGAGGAEGAIPGIPDLQFYAELPTAWDQTHVLAGYPGKHVTIARKSGENWFVGALNGTEELIFDIDLSFLDSNITYVADIYSDDPSMDTRTKLKIESIEVDSQSVISRRVLPRNGMALIIRPKTN